MGYRESMTIYIAGKMRGEECFNFERFFWWARTLKRRGYDVFNPAQHDCERWLNDGWIYTEDQYEEVLAFDFEMIEKSDIVFMMKGWESSPGAIRERSYALELGKQIWYEEDEQEVF